jgi:hypothetical protein
MPHSLIRLPASEQAPAASHMRKTSHNPTSTSPGSYATAKTLLLQKAASPHHAPTAPGGRRQETHMAQGARHLQRCTKACSLRCPVPALPSITPSLSPAPRSASDIPRPPHSPAEGPTCSSCGITCQAKYQAYGQAMRLPGDRPAWGWCTPWCQCSAAASRQAGRGCMSCLRST